MENRGSNIAFKYHFCDGGATDRTLGFCGICTEETRNYNKKVGSKGNWCANEECLIDSYRWESTVNGCYPCFESQVLRDWRALSNRKIKNAKSGSLCILTTVNKHDKEDQRYIFAVFIIDDVDGIDEGYGAVAANPKYRIVMSLKEAEQLKFWDFYFNDKKPDSKIWGNGFTHYFEDEIAIKVLRRIIKIKRNMKEKQMAEKMLHLFVNE